MAGGGDGEGDPLCAGVNLGLLALLGGRSCCTCSLSDDESESEDDSSETDDVSLAVCAGSREVSSDVESEDEDDDDTSLLLRFLLRFRGRTGLTEDLAIADASCPQPIYQVSAFVRLAPDKSYRNDLAQRQALLHFAFYSTFIPRLSKALFPGSIHIWNNQTSMDKVVGILGGSGLHTDTSFCSEG